MTIDGIYWTSDWVAIEAGSTDTSAADNLVEELFAAESRSLVRLARIFCDDRDAAEADHETLTALRTLPDRQRACLVLRYYLDLSERDIADTLDISKNSVKTHTRRGLAALKAQLATPTEAPSEEGER